MTYRDWRELTKMILTAKRKGYSPSVPKSKLRRPESHVYRNWVEHEIDRNPKEFEEFNNGKGIIKARERFLKWLETKEGQDALQNQGVAKSSSTGSKSKREAGAEGEVWEKDKVVIVPVAGESFFKLLNDRPLTFGCSPRKRLVGHLLSWKPRTNAPYLSGKTVVGLALRKLFGFGHTQSDDIKAKKTAQQFKANIVTLLKNNRVVFADRYDHHQPF